MTNLLVQQDPGLDRKRQLANALMQRGMQGGPVYDPMQGIGRLAQTLAGAYMGKQADEAQKARQAEFMSGIQGALQGGDNQALAQALMGGGPQAQMLGMKSILSENQAKKDAIAQEQARIDQFEDFKKRQLFKQGISSQMPVGSEEKLKLDKLEQEIRLKNLQAEKLETEKAEREIKKERKKEKTEEKASFMLEEIGKAKKQADPKSFGPDPTGLYGQVTQFIGGTDARDLAARLDTIKANIGFDELQKMRDASPTGGALGNVSEKEVAFLQALAGSIDISQGTEQLVSNLERLEKEFKRVANKGLTSKEESAFDVGQVEEPDKPAKDNKGWGIVIEDID